MIGDDDTGGDGGGEGDLPDEILDLLQEWPQLTMVPRFTAQAKAIAWFGRCGERIGPRERLAARDYLDGLGFPDADLVPVRDWAEAADAASSLTVDGPAWEAEEQLRAALTNEALALIDEETLELLTRHLQAEVARPIGQALQEQAAIWDLADAHLINAAAGSAILAVHQAFLTLLSTDPDPDHPFAAKYRLYEAGRWPIGVAGMSFNLL